MKRSTTTVTPAAHRAVFLAGLIIMAWGGWGKAVPEGRKASAKADIGWYITNPGAARFTISTADELAGLAQIVNGTWGGGPRNFSGKTITLARNIDLSAYYKWTPIGNYLIDGDKVDNLNAFSGTFDGGGRVISGLAIAHYRYAPGAEAACHGLFGYIKGGRVENLGLENVKIDGGWQTGGVAGKIEDNSSIANCYSTGTVSGGHTGGVAGFVDGNSSITNSYSAGTVEGAYKESVVGGVAGYVREKSRVANCYSTSTVSSISWRVGGIVGSASHASRVTDCAALSSVLKGTRDYSVRRVTGGNENFVEDAFSNNVAYASMINNPGNTAWEQKGAGRRDGADIAVADIRADPTIGGRFTAKDGWTTEKGKLPGLRGAAAEFPTHFLIHVAVSPADQRVYMGGTRQFRATVSGESRDKTVTWTVSGNTSAATTVSAAGLLTVAEDEKWLAKLTVTATSTVNTAVSATAKVTVKEASETRWYTDAIAANPKATVFTISTAGELESLAKITSGTWGGEPERDNFSGKTIKLAGNIDLSAYDSWAPAGEFVFAHGREKWEKQPFSGTFDGGGYVISNLTIRRPDSDYQGLFRHIEGGRVINLVLENVNIRGGKNVGSVAGLVESGSVISDCRFTGAVSGDENVGGLAGLIQGNSSVTGCNSAGAVSARDSVAGGVAGYLWRNCSVANSHSTGVVSAKGGSAGGVAGVLNDNCSVTGSNSAASVCGKIRNGGIAGIISESCRVTNSRFTGTINSGACSGGSGGSFTDARDKRKYRTVEIGKQVWMAENLNYKADSSWCYDNADSNCVKYGRLYTWDAALSACPAGWHLPSYAEWTALTEFDGGEWTGSSTFGTGKRLKAESGWKWNNHTKNFGKGTNDYGFSALPGGSGHDGKFSGAGDDGYWWSATENKAKTYSAWAWFIYYGNDNLKWHDDFKTMYFSVRCVRDTAGKTAPAKGGEPD